MRDLWSSGHEDVNVLRVIILCGLISENNVSWYHGTYESTWCYNLQEHHQYIVFSNAKQFKLKSFWQQFLLEVL